MGEKKKAPKQPPKNRVFFPKEQKGWGKRLFGGESFFFAKIFGKQKKVRKYRVFLGTEKFFFAPG